MSPRDELKAGRVLITLSEIERFFKSVDKQSDCWLWKGRLDEFGYGIVHVRYISLGTHVLSYLLNFGAIPNGLCVCHSCDVRNCVNPKHLWLGTHLDNMQDMARKGRAVPYIKNGIRSNAALLTPEKVAEIRRCVELGATKADTARRFGIGASTVWNIVTRRTWRHVCSLPSSY